MNKETGILGPRLDSSNASRWTQVCVLALCVTGVTGQATKDVAGAQTMHCFLFSGREDATEKHWRDFRQMTSELPKEVPVVKRVWQGRLAVPHIVYVPDGETRRLLAARGESGLF